MNRENRGSHACPLCRRQRRRCVGNCEFGQYFPASRSDEFENAFRLFGLNYMLRIMRSAEPHQRQAAADSIMTEGTAWRNNSPHGLLGYELELRSQIQSSLRELESVNQLLSFCREPNPPSQPHQGTQMSTLSVTPAGDLGGMDPIKPNRPETFPTSHERGQSSTVASKENVKEKESEAPEKGKEIIAEENESETDD